MFFIRKKYVILILVFSLLIVGTLLAQNQGASTSEREKETEIKEKKNPQTQFLILLKGVPEGKYDTMESQWQKKE